MSCEKCSTTIEWEEIIDNCDRLNAFVEGCGDSKDKLRENNRTVQWEGKKHGKYRVRSRSRPSREKERPGDVVTKKIAAPKLPDRKRVCKRFSKCETNCDICLKKYRRVSILKLNEQDKKREPNTTRVRRRSGSVTSKVSSRAIKTVDFEKPRKKHSSRSDWTPAWQESVKFKQEKYKINDRDVDDIEKKTSQQEVKSYRKRASNITKLQSWSAEISKKRINEDWDDTDDENDLIPRPQDFEDALRYYMKASKWIERNQEHDTLSPRLRPPKNETLPIVRWEHRQPGKGDHWRRGMRGEFPYVVEVKRATPKKSAATETAIPVKNSPFAGVKVRIPFLRRDPWLILPNIILLFLPTFLAGLILRFALEPLLLDDDYL